NQAAEDSSQRRPSSRAARPLCRTYKIRVRPDAHRSVSAPLLSPPLPLLANEPIVRAPRAEGGKNEEDRARFVRVEPGRGVGARAPRAVEGPKGEVHEMRGEAQGLPQRQGPLYPMPGQAPAMPRRKRSFRDM